jgi:hypothetical protein
VHRRVVHGNGGESPWKQQDNMREKKWEMWGDGLRSTSAALCSQRERGMADLKIGHYTGESGSIDYEWVEGSPGSLRCEPAKNADSPVGMTANRNWRMEIGREIPRSARDDGEEEREEIGWRSIVRAHPFRKRRGKDGAPSSSSVGRHWSESGATNRSIRRRR